MNQVNFAFVPQNVVINVGDTVRWVRSGGVHDVAEGLDDIIDGTEAFFGLLDSANPIFEFTFDEAFLAACLLYTSDAADHPEVEVRGAAVVIEVAYSRVSSEKGLIEGELEDRIR